MIHFSFFIPLIIFPNHTNRNTKSNSKSNFFHNAWPHSSFFFCYLPLYELGLGEFVLSLGLGEFAIAMEVETPKESRKSNKRSYGLANRKTKGLATKVPNKKNCTSWNQDYNIDFGDVPKEDFLNNTIHATKNVAVPLKVSRKNPMYKTPKKSPLPVQVANNKRPSGTNYSTKDRVGKGVQIAKPGYTFANARTAVNSPKAGAFQLAKKSPSEYTRVANSDQKWTKLLKVRLCRMKPLY